MFKNEKKNKKRSKSNFLRINENQWLNKTVHRSNSYRLINNNISQNNKINDKSKYNCEESFIKSAFDLIDSDNKGYLSPSDLRKLLVCIGLNPSRSAVFSLLCELDSDNTGEITFENFLNIYYKKYEGSVLNKKNNKKNTFQQIANNNNYITEDSFINSFIEMGLEVSLSEFSELFEIAKEAAGTTNNKIDNSALASQNIVIFFSV